MVGNRLQGRRQGLPVVHYEAEGGDEGGEEELPILGELVWPAPAPGRACSVGGVFWMVGWDWVCVFWMRRWVCLWFWRTHTPMHPYLYAQVHAHPMKAFTSSPPSPQPSHPQCADYDL